MRACIHARMHACMRAHTHARTHIHMAVSVGVRQELLLDHAGERAAWRTETWCISQRTAAWINPFLRLDSTSEPVAYGTDGSCSSWTHRIRTVGRDLEGTQSSCTGFMDYLTIQRGNRTRQSRASCGIQARISSKDSTR